MSKLLDQLRQAEAQRERLAAERAAAQAGAQGVARPAAAPATVPETEAARLAELRREIERATLELARLAEARRQIEARPAAPQAPRVSSPWRWFAAPVAAALGFALYYGSLPGPVSPSHNAAAPSAAAAWALRFDRDDAAFAARVKERGKR